MEDIKATIARFKVNALGLLTARTMGMFDGELQWPHGLPKNATEERAWALMNRMQRQLEADSQSILAFARSIGMNASPVRVFTGEPLDRHWGEAKACLGEIEEAATPGTAEVKASGRRKGARAINVEQAKDLLARFQRAGEAKMNDYVERIAVAMGRSRSTIYTYLADDGGREPRRMGDDESRKAGLATRRKRGS